MARNLVSARILQTSPAIQARRWCTRRADPIVVPVREHGMLRFNDTQEERTMNWDQIKGKWKQAKGQAQQKWGQLTDDDLDQVAGQREELVGKVQERYGIARAAAEAQVSDF